MEADKMKKCTTRIRKVLICLMLHSLDYFNCAMETLREECISGGRKVSARPFLLVNFK
jgi:hypothetical protein